jgi:hypothetical protein
MEQFRGRPILDQQQFRSAAIEAAPRYSRLALGSARSVPAQPPRQRCAEKPCQRAGAFSGFNLGSTVAECQGQDSAPGQLVGVADRSHNAPARGAPHPRDGADRPATPAATARSRRSVSGRHRSNPEPYFGHSGRQSASLGDHPDNEELIGGLLGPSERRKRTNLLERGRIRRGRILHSESYTYSTGLHLSTSSMVATSTSPAQLERIRNLRRGS